MIRYIPYEMESQNYNEENQLISHSIRVRDNVTDELYQKEYRTYEYDENGCLEIEFFEYFRKDGSLRLAITNTYFNNSECWPDSLVEAYTPNQFGDFKYIRKNIYTYSDSLAVQYKQLYHWTDTSNVWKPGQVYIQKYDDQRRLIYKAPFDVIDPDMYYEEYWIYDEKDRLVSEKTCGNYILSIDTLILLNNSLFKR